MAFFLALTLSIVSIASLITISKVLSSKGSFKALPCKTLILSSKPVFFTLILAFSNAWLSKSIPVILQLYFLANSIEVVHILHATSNTFVCLENSPFSVNQSVASIPPGRSFFFLNLAKKLCPISLCFIFFTSQQCKTYCTLLH